MRASKMQFPKMKDTFADVFGAPQSMCWATTNTTRPTHAAQTRLAPPLSPPIPRARKARSLVAPAPPSLALEKNKAPEPQLHHLSQQQEAQCFDVKKQNVLLSHRLSKPAVHQERQQELPRRRHDECDGGQAEDAESRHVHRNLRYVARCSMSPGEDT